MSYVQHLHASNIQTNQFHMTDLIVQFSENYVYHPLYHTVTHPLAHRTHLQILYDSHIKQ
jgi:hypothetical protein